MHAVILHETGGPERLRIERLPIPPLASGEVRVRVHAAALNRRDIFITRGLYPGIVLPAQLGSDGVGIVDAVAQYVLDVEVGSEVVINPMLGWGHDSRVWSEGAQVLGMPHPGTLAQYCVVPARNIARKPGHLSFEEAAALPLAGLTAYRALVTRGRVQAGERVLVTGAGGGVQSFVLRFAQALGAHVVATSGSDAKIERLRELGVEQVIDYRDEQWAKQLRGVGPIDLAVDSAGGDAFARALDAVRPGGRVVTYGGTTPQATVRLFSIFWKHLDVLGSSMGSPQDFAAMLALVVAERITPIIDRAYPLDQIILAAQRLEASEQFGKIVIAVE